MTDVSQDNTTYTPSLQIAESVYNSETFNAEAFSALENPISTGVLDSLLVPLTNEELKTAYSEKLNAVTENAHFDDKSFDPKKDSVSNYSVNLNGDSGSVKVTEVTIAPKGADFNAGNQSGRERFDLTEKSGDKLVVAHNYSTHTIFDKTNNTLALNSAKADVMRSSFTGTTPDKVRSALTVVNRENTHLVKDVLKTVRTLNEAQTTHSSTVGLNSNHAKVETLNDANLVSSRDVYDVNYVNLDKDADVAYRLHYITKHLINGDTERSSKILAFHDKDIAISATESIDDAGKVSGNLVVRTENFSLNTTLSSVDTMGSLLPEDKLGGYGDKVAIDGVFLENNNTTFKGTADADIIRINSKATGLGVSGNAGDDTIIGGVNSDTLNGDEGSDVIRGGKGADKMDAGADDAKDTFIIGNQDSGLDYTADDKNNADVIKNFKTGSDKLALGVAGTDKNFTSLTETDAADFAAAKIAANDALAVLKVSGEKFAFVADSENGYLFEDVNGDGKADQVIVLTGVAADGLIATDIIAS